MKICLTARTSFISASTLVARTSVNVIRACTLLMENAEVMKWGEGTGGFEPPASPTL